MDGITCCVSCGWGKGGTPASEIEQQTAKHGEYNCVSCEEVWEGILNAPKGEVFKINKGYGSPSEALISENAIYYFDGPKVADPNRSFLGFGGSWHLIIKDYPREYGTTRKAFVCNNLWHSRSVPKSYRQRLKDAGKIDSIVIGIESSQLADLRDLLNEIKYF